MIHPFANTLENEILISLEDNQNDISNISKDELEYLKRFHPILAYLYEERGIPELDLSSSDEVIIESDVIKRNQSLTSFIIPTRDRIKVDVKVNTKQPRTQRKLEEFLRKHKFKLDRITDLEFFEYKYSHSILFNYLIESKILSPTDFQRLREKIIESNVSEIVETLRMFGEETFSLEEFYRVLDIDSNIVDTSSMTALLDIEKIHLQFATISQGNSVKDILVYFGYGNHYPFTKNVPGKNISDKRFMVIDQINGALSREYFEQEFKKTVYERREFILDRINHAQRLYPEYFNLNFRYEDRLERFSGHRDTQEVDRLLILNPKIRSKSAALIAFNLIKQNKVLSIQV